MTKHKCVIAGPHGIVGRAIAEHMENCEDWEAIGVSRRFVEAQGKVKFVAADLLDPTAIDRALGQIDDVTHVFFAAYAPRETIGEEVVPNLAMLRNLVETVERSSPRLERVLVVQGSKWYGNHLGPYRTPAREDDPRHLPPNFYYDQQDWLEAHQRGKQWTWSAFRPHGICGQAVGSPMNHLLGLALYASISREFGLPLRFPGTPGAFRSVYQFTDAELLARSLTWAATSTSCANQAFNITNGEYERWENLWPAIADCFGLEAGAVQTISLARFMADKEPVWAEMRKRYSLQPHTLQELVNWSFMDWAYGNAYDQMSSLARIRSAGWHETLDAERMFKRLIERLRRDRIIP